MSAENSGVLFDEARASFENPQDFFLGLATPLIGLLPGHALTWALTGELSTGGAAGLVWLWTAVGIWWLSLLVARRDMVGLSRPPLPISLWIAGTLQLVWLMAATWVLTPWWSIVIGLAFAGLFANDLRFFQDSRSLLATTVGGGIAGLVWIAMADPLWSGGFASRYEGAPAQVIITASLYVSIVTISAIFLMSVGRQMRLLAENQERSIALTRQLAVSERERQVIRRSAAFLASGVQATQFSHDVKGPLTVLGLNLDYLEILAKRAPKALSTELLDLTDELHHSRGQLYAMTAAMADALREGGTPEPTTVSELLESGQERFETMLPAYGRKPPTLDVEVDDLPVWATPGIPAVIGNLFLNSTVHGSTVLTIRVDASDAAFLVLMCRDNGVSEQERPEALLRVRSRLDLEATRDMGGRTHQGPEPRSYGMALLLAKIQLLRTAGWLDVAAPKEGPGFVFLLALPRQDPSTIDAEHDRPREACMAVTLG